MACVFAVGVVWRERGPADAKGHGVDPAGAEANAAPPARDAGTRRWAPAALATGAVVLAVSMGGARPVPTTDPASLAAAVVPPQGGWAARDEPLSSWRPSLHNPALLVSKAFTKDGEAVGVHIGLFHRPTPHSKLTSAMNRLLEPDGLNREWKLAQQGTTQVRCGAESVTVRTAVLIGRGVRLAAWQWYGVDGQITAEPVRAAWLQALARWRGRDDVSKWTAIYTRDETDPAPASRRLAAFVAEMGPPIGCARAGAGKVASPSMPAGVGKESAD
jgi:EpsI family protein